jgi:hypothetical protein
MSNEEIVRNLADSCDAVRMHLERKAPRKAAQAVCDGLRGLVNDNGSFWANFASASEQLSKYQDDVKHVLYQLVEFVNLEGAVLPLVGVDIAASEAILSDVYGMTAIGLGILKKDIEQAADLICKNVHGPVRRAVDWVLSVKGLRILGGATVTAANFALLHSPGIIAPYVSPALKPMSDLLLPASMSFGGWCMGEEAKKIIELLKPKSDE